MLRLGALHAQVPDAPDARVTHTTARLRLDGIPDEPAWRTADSISDFTQKEPTEGRPATERTVVRLLDPLRDHRTGFLFSVNPNGAMTDAQVIDFETTTPDWNGVWDARACITPVGWTAELFIPWQTLRYHPSHDTWGINFRRLIRRANEEVLWRAWRRTEGILLRPYGAVTGQARAMQYPPAGNDSVLSLGSAALKAGFDAKLAPAPTLTLDLTANTDFAQVEAAD